MQPKVVGAPGFIYFACTDDRDIFKVGQTMAPHARAGTLRQQGRQKCGRPLHVIGVMPGTLADESAILKRFESIRHPFGTDWLSGSPELLEYISGLNLIPLREVAGGRNVTSIIDDNVYRELRIECLRRGTDASAVIQRLIERQLAEWEKEKSQ